VTFGFKFFARLTVAQVFGGQGEGEKRLRESAGVCASLREPAGRNRAILVQIKFDGLGEKQKLGKQRAEIQDHEINGIRKNCRNRTGNGSAGASPHLGECGTANQKAEIDFCNR
jgi:hypothetical protein